MKKKKQAQELIVAAHCSCFFPSHRTCVNNNKKKKVWGSPAHDDQLLFEMLALESFQAGLSWSTVLKKRENFRAAFVDWDVKKVSQVFL